MGKLVLTFNPEWSILDASVEHGHFRGRGDAYFPTDEVSEFIVSLQAYPLKRADLVLRSPGLISISVFPADGVGHLFVRIEVAEEIEARDFARVRLRTDYSRLSRFASQLSLMAKGEVSEIILEEDKA
ncbi:MULTISPECIES: hypothetical protein [unclassified Mesorhizobium]|uniref:WapI family immunity protein n=1 Tax=unclassified Mesorhizobium TaxID=325217 RepID=UPI0003D01531|nr:MULTISPECIES: hypothetical protein [unclassified Mesorhizobium]ESZ30556.1 hypothetical protein X734_00520 [Mesorhizobium sp. L2C084A000]RUW94815.1 hypothetical protein EOA19_01790 [Mesorhizobium sp. M7A.F.Ca.US.010.02.1.1]